MSFTIWNLIWYRVRAPVDVFIAITTPTPQFQEAGKGALVLTPKQREALDTCITSAAKGWYTQAKRTSRTHELGAAEARRVIAEAKEKPITIKDACIKVMVDAYMAASNNNTLPANARQIMYAARARVLPLTNDRWYKDAKTFTQDILPDFIAANPEITADLECGL